MTMFALITKSLEHVRQHTLLDQLLDRQPTRSLHRRAARLHPPQRRKILFESLEPRLLLSADLLPGTVPTGPLAPDIHLTPPAATSPQIRWTAPVSTGDAPLYASSMVSDFDLDNFSSPLSPVAPAGGRVHAGGVTGSLDFDFDSDTLSIALDADQTFSLRLTPSANLQGRMEAFDPDGNTLGAIEASNAGDSLVLQVRAAATTGTYSVQVDSLAGAGSYTVELFLNAALEDPDTTDAASAQDLDGVFSTLLDSPATRAAVVGSMSAPLGTRVLAQEDFEDAQSFQDDQINDIWVLANSNPDAAIYRVQYGEGSGANLEMRADQSPDYALVEVGNGEGGTYLQDQYTYEASLGYATWRVNLAGVQAAQLEFDQSGDDPNGDTGASSEFQGTSDFDGVALSVDGENWIVLQEFDAIYSEGSSHSVIDLVASAAQHGLTLGPDTLIRFQQYDAGGVFTYTRDAYRTFDNIRITTDQQQVLLVPVETTSTGLPGDNFNNALALLTDNQVPTEGSDFDGAGSVWWFNQEAGPVESAPTDLSVASGELSGLVFGLDLGSAQSLSGLLLSLDNNDDYAVDYSLDGFNWTRLVDILESDGDIEGGMDTFRLGSADAQDSGDPSFLPVVTQYLRFYATGGDGLYAIGDIQAFTEGTSDQEDWYQLTLSEGELASFTLSLEVPADNATMGLALYDADHNLVTAGLSVGGQVAQSIENFKAPATGTYTLRVTGSTLGEYNLVAVKQAQFGPATNGAQDLTLTPIVLDAVKGSGSPIRVAVVGGGYIVDQLADDTYRDFSVSNVWYDEIDTAQELANYDVVVLGNNSDSYLLNALRRPCATGSRTAMAWSPPAGCSTTPACRTAM
jgi:hypothetical protein